MFPSPDQVLKRFINFPADSFRKEVDRCFANVNEWCWHGDAVYVYIEIPPTAEQEQDDALEAALESTTSDLKKAGWHAWCSGGYFYISSVPPESLSEFLEEDVDADDVDDDDEDDGDEDETGIRIEYKG